MPSPTTNEKSVTLQLPSSSNSPLPSRPQSPPTSRPQTPRLPESGKPLSIAQRRNGEGNGFRIVHGIPLPPDMAAPREDGYRTPMGEDYEFHFERRQIQLENIAPDQASTNGRVSFLSREHRWSRPGSAGRSHLSLNAVSEMLDDKIHWKQRLRHFTWNFFSMTMATGGIANVIRGVPYRFAGLDTIGTIFFLFNLCLFITNIFCISVRFFMWPETLRASVTHPTESLFMPAAIVSLGTVLLNISQYGLGKVGFWLNDAVLVLFWFYVVFAILASTCTYILMWSTQTFTIAQMTPIWIFPAYPLLLVGPFAGFLAGMLEQQRALDTIIAGFTCQGIGYLVSITIYSAFIYRLMTQKLPREAVRPGMFVSVGPSGFTCGAMINMAAAASIAFPDGFMGNGPLAASIVKVVANFAALWIWGLAIWFFIISVGAHWSCFGHGGLEFAMTWFSFIFPNTALITATFAIGNAFDSTAIKWIGCVMTCILIAGWFFVFAAMIRAIALKHILWPQKQDDKDEGGFKAPKPSKTFMMDEKNDEKNGMPV